MTAQHVAPPRIDDPTVADQPTRARDTVTDIQYQKLDTALRQALDTDPATPVRVILRTAPGASGTTAEWFAAEGRQIHQLHPSFGGLTSTLSASDVAVLTEDPSIRQMSIDAIVEPAKGKKGTPGAALKGSLGLTGKKGDAASGNRTWAGKGITVAVIDSGIEPSQDLPKSRIVSFRDFANGGTETDPYDDNGHGTHVAGLIGGNGKASKLEYRGAASEVSFVGLKVLDAEGTGYTSDVLAAIEQVIAVNKAAEMGRKNKNRIDIINLSLGHPIYEPAAKDPLVQAVERAVSEGIVVVASARNMGRSPETGEAGYAGISSPGNAPSAITVGAVNVNGTTMRADDTVPVYSSRGPTWYDAYVKPDVVAPGHQLVAAAALESTLYREYPELHVAWDPEKPSGYVRLSGTSMAAAVTSGIVAVVLEASEDNGATGSYDADVLNLFRGAAGGDDAFASGDQTQLIVGKNPFWADTTSTTSLGGVASDDTDKKDKEKKGKVKLEWGRALSPNAVKAILQYTAIPMDDYDVLTQDAGALNAHGAVRLANAIDTRVRAGEYWLSTTVTPADIIGGATLAWGQRIIWGDRLVWGDSIFWKDSAWALRLVWGDLADFMLNGQDTAFAQSVDLDN